MYNQYDPKTPCLPALMKHEIIKGRINREPLGYDFHQELSDIIEPSLQHRGVIDKAHKNEGNDKSNSSIEYNSLSISCKQD